MSTTLNLLRNPKALAILLGVITLALFWPATRLGFIELDDDVYVSENPHVQQGLTGPSVAWAVTEVTESYWLPATWLSFILDRTLQGPAPGGYHRTNVALHAANVVLLFLLGYQLTGHRWGSVLMAALFGWHPLRVEAVVWISSRKDVLSTLFGLLAIMAYVRFVRRNQGRWTVTAIGNYLLIMMAMAAGLMAKPMWVTLPFILLLLDFWPLKRFGWPLGRRLAVPNAADPALNVAENRPLESSDSPPAAVASQASPFGTKSFGSLLVEKGPLFLLTVVFVWITLATHHSSGSLQRANAVSGWSQFAEVPVNYCRYLMKMIWPVDLAVRYPAFRLPMLPALALAAGLMGVTAWFWRSSRRRPWLLVGWLWFLGAFVPIIGLVRVGTADFADRFTYVPSIGISLIAAGMFVAVFPSRFPGTRSLAAIFLVVASALATSQQMVHWRDGETLFRRALEVTRNNAPAHNALGRALEKQERWAEAMAEYQESLRIAPDFGQAHANLATVLGRLRRFDEAAAHFRAALQGSADDAKIHSNFGSILIESGNAGEGVKHLREAIRLNPHLADAHFNLGQALRASGESREALEQFLWAARINPGDDAAHFEAGRLYLAEGENDLARSCFEAALRRQPGHPDYQMALREATLPKNQK